MIIIHLSMLTEEECRFTPVEAPFKGGVIHGLVEHRLAQRSAPLWAQFRGQTHQMAGYALQVPQDNADHWPQGHVFQLGIVLFAQAQAQWREVLNAFTQGPPLRLGSARSVCSAQDVRILRPNAPDLSLLQAMGQPGRQLGTWQATRPAAQPCDELQIKLLAPANISNETRRGLGQQAALPLSLSSIIASLQRRVQALEPQLAMQYAFDAPEWADCVRSIWPHQIASASQITARPWPYASRNTPGQQPVTITGIEGQMQFTGPTPEPIASLLQIGQWMGMGQKTSMGMGWYGVGVVDSPKGRQ